MFFWSLTGENLGLFVLRIALASVFLFHAMPKLKNPSALAQSMKWSPVLVSLLGLVEIVGSVSIVLGIFTELGALLLVLVMLGALYLKLFVWKTPFSGQNGWELDLILLASALAVMATDGGSWGLS